MLCQHGSAVTNDRYQDQLQRARTATIGARSCRAHYGSYPQVAPRNLPFRSVPICGLAIDGAFAPGKLMLWGAPLIGTLVLAFAAAVILRGTVKTRVD
jgi:hypothetical protein